MVKWAEGVLLQAIPIDRDSEPPLTLQIAAGLREMILGGALKPGERLPATRTLAEELCVARATIVESFERLVAEGLLETRIGSGTFVSLVVDAERPTPPPRAPQVPIQSARLARSMTLAAERFVARLPHEPRPFTTALPAYDAFPMGEWTRLAARHWRNPRHQVLGYPDPSGYRPLREAIAAHLRTNRGIHCDWNCIFIVAGAQHAFQLIAGALIDPGDTVWFEDPGAIGARNSLVMQGAGLVPVPVDDAGLNVERGLELAPHFALAFVTPSHQQPLGAKLSLERRFALLKAAAASSAFVIEDDWDGEFCFEGQPLPTLKGVDAAERVIYVGTFSKSLFPALRLGYLLAPPSLVPTFESSLAATSPGVPTALQATVADFIAEGHFATHVRRMRRLYAERYQTLVETAQTLLGDWLDIVPTTTGMHTVGFFKQGLDAERVCAEAARLGLTVAPISRFCIAPYPRQGVVLGFSGFSPAQIRAGMPLLRQAVLACAGDAAPGGMR
ncbi:MocR-like pyridoxine biosynthesis transcription factor PdxR [Ancylobacter amanitiformis]|uniref:GntR family transcriptional regulator/MocR family aminotransferase n=1 Tax=Ancylobacter amanitiformis TaxID=217069 RepID=A0ABU0LT02_9HYPH|nr:PLP-dependent aminotransferase family protein [Ancylobacter amanitiformis]MDQ0511770.1 GntR family transcriptional regulator/MocR family aminotransferase [Ancylobacter amanitiformis]